MKIELSWNWAQFTARGIAGRALRRGWQAEPTVQNWFEYLQTYKFFFLQQPHLLESCSAVGQWAIWAIKSTSWGSIPRGCFPRYVPWSQDWVLQSTRLPFDSSRRIQRQLHKCLSWILSSAAEWIFMNALTESNSPVIWCVSTVNCETSEAIPRASKQHHMGKGTCQKINCQAFGIG